MGRPQKYRNAADKQKAYRERQKAQQIEDSALFELVSVLDQREQSLRNVFDYWRKKGMKVEIQIGKSLSHGNHAQVMVDGRFNQTTNELLCQYLIAKKVLVLVRTQWSGNYYQLIDCEEPNGQTNETDKN